MSVIITLIIFTVIVVVHEGGHFWASKMCNVYIEEFAVGMGPKLFGFKKGETLYSVRLLPIGGFCRMADEKPEDTNKIGFNDANVFQRIFIALAGPLMNFVLALAVLTFMAMSTGVSTNIVKDVSEDSAAAEAGIQEGDRIVAINGTKINIRSDIDFYMTENPEAKLQLTVDRNGERLKYNLEPRYDKESGRRLMGVTTLYKAPCLNMGIYSADEVEGVPKSTVIDCVRDGFYNMCFLVKVTVIGVVRMLTFNVSVNEISGPIGVTTVVGDAYKETAKAGAIYTVLTMLNLGALLSANLGVINLVPIPALDGGRIFVYLIEIIRRKKLPPEKEGLINLVGFALVMGFGIFIAVSDVLKLI